MSTTVQSVYDGFLITNINQIKAYTEGDMDPLVLDPMDLITALNYSKDYTITFTIESANYANVRILQTSTSGPQLQQSGNTYTLTSTYQTALGLGVNNWAYFKLALRGLYLEFTNSDWGETFNISVFITDGESSLADQIQIITTAHPDVTGNIQSISVPMAMNGPSLTSAGGNNVVISDPDEAMKTYRVTYSVNDATNASGTSDVNLNNSVIGVNWLKTFTVSGTQSYINSVIASSGVNNGLYFHNYSPDFYGQATISYTQEVLTSTEPGVIVPYVQETGTLILNTTYTAPFSIGANQNYTEDSSVTFSLGSITDLAGDSWSYETCGNYSGFNCYNVTATVLGSFTGANPVKLTYSGDSSVDNVVSFTGTKAAVNALLASVQLIPPADYTDPLTIQVVVTRGNTPITLFTGNITATCTSTHSEFSIIGGAPFVIGNNDINFGSITDLATSKNYTVTLDCLQPSATYGTLTDLSGTGTWNGTGGPSSYGRLTISGTLTVVNASLAGIRYTTGSGSSLADSISFTYTQTQTTNSLSQGTTTTTLNNSYVWGSGNYSGSFVFDENTKMTYNLGYINVAIAGTAKAEITLGTPFSTANGGSITGWTKVSDTVWTFSGTKAAVNAALASTEFVPPADLRTNFTVDMKIYDDATVVYSSVTYSTTKTFSIRTTYPYISANTPIQLLLGGNSAEINMGSVIDVRSTNISTAITYSVVLTPSSLTQITSMSSAGSGGTTSWSGTALTITGTKTQLNSHLSTVTINYLGNADSTITWTQTQTTNSVSQGAATINVLKPAPQYMFLSSSGTARTSDLNIWDIDTLPNIRWGGYTYQRTASFNNNKWVVIVPDVLSGNIANINKSTSTSWTAATMPVGIPYFSEEHPTFAGSAVGSNTRISVWYDGAGGTGFNNHAWATYTTNDTSYTSFQFNEGAGSGIWDAGTISHLNNMFHFPFISREYYIRMASSANGTTWTYQDLATGTTICNIGKEMTFSNSKYGLPIVVSGTLRLYFSTDGTTWSAGNVSSNARNTTAALYNGSYWIVMGNSRTDSILKAYKSTNGTTWTNTSIGVTADTDSAAPRLAYGNSAWVTINANKIYESTNGTTWTERSIGFTPFRIYSVKFFNSKFYALVSLTNNNSRLMESVDGITWTTTYIFPSGSNWSEMAYSG